MVIRNLKNGRRLAVFALFAILALSAFGFAASNTVEPTNAGDGTGEVSGGDVTNVHYTVGLVGGEPMVTGVTFDYTSDVAPGTVAAGVVDSGGVILGGGVCSGSGSYTCTFDAPVEITPIADLRVVTFS